MPSTRDIRRRIRGVTNIRQVTRAMNMIAAARLRRAQTKAENARPYAERIAAILQDVQAGGGGLRHPLLLERPLQRVGLVLVSSDRGLAGAFNANVIREAEHALEQAGAPCGLITVGKKGRDHFRARGAVIDAHFPQPSRDVTLGELGQISQRVLADYTGQRYDRLLLVYARFVSVLKSQPVTEQLLPLPAPTAPGRDRVARTVYEFEPAAEQLLNTLLPQYVEVAVYRALVESLASEQAARMLAMKTATDSASDIITDLTRDYNRLRQTSITTQILEVVSGAEALGHEH